MSDNLEHPDLLDERSEHAITARLARLKARPLDLTRLKRRIEQDVPRPKAARPLRWWGPLRAVAAALLVATVAIIALALATASSPAMASAERMADVHASVSSMARTVGSLEEAESLLRTQWPGQPGLPTDVPDEQPLACCIHSLDGKQMSCLSLNLEGDRVSIAVGRADDFKIPPGARRVINGHEYVIDSAKGINMVMTKRNGRWVCVMSPLPVERLVAFTEEVVW